MKRIKKKIFLGFNASLLVVLGVVRHCNPSVMGVQAVEEPADSLSVEVEASAQTENEPQVESLVEKHEKATGMESRKYHRIRGVVSYDKEFPDLQETQIVAARKWGVSPVADRAVAESRKDELVYVASHPYYSIDKRMNSSIPYLVPRASALLQTIGRNFLDSLSVKGVPLHKIIVTSVLRTEADVAKLLHQNGNASDQSCHRFGTTFDIAYNRYETVSPPGEERRAVRDDSLKYVLCEVLRDLRQQNLCYIKYERKQGCFHITTR